MEWVVGLRYDPWAHAEDLVLTVQECKLPKDQRGEYRHHERLVLLAKVMTDRQKRATLAHEIQHALAGDLPTPFGYLHAKQERRARLGAAKQLVCAVEYAEAEQVSGTHISDLAFQLNVTSLVISDWRYASAMGGAMGGVLTR